MSAGVAAHLGLPLRLVRIIFVLLTPLAGAGVLLYGFWWALVPAGDPEDVAVDERPVALSRLSRPQRLARLRTPTKEATGAIVLIVIAAALFVRRTSWGESTAWLVPSLLLVAGVTLAWSRLDEALSGERPTAFVSIARVAGGIMLAGVAVLMLISGGADAKVQVRSWLAAIGVLLGVGLVLAPWWVRLTRALGDERAARAREAERADIAAHLHDSVLQTLALIRARSDDAAEVARMARAQERELREWLYDDRPAPGTSVAAMLRDLVAEVEDTRQGSSGSPVAIDVVVVGDRAPDADSDALLQATREALVNAVIHGRPPVSVYLEVAPDAMEVFVLDHGDGFSMDDIAADRFGVRESILGRVKRRGGTAEVRSVAGSGTEIHLRIQGRSP